MESLISIIVPVYKVEKYLDKCINSILNQSFANFELILVNDGSPDNCGSICDKYAKMDSRVKVLHKENGGLSSARNEGLNVAKGDYVAFVDSDDFIHPNMYEILHKHAILNSSDIIICDYSKVYPEAVLCSIPMTKQNVKARNLTNLETLKQFYTNNGTTFIVAWNKLYKRNLFEKLRFKEGKIHEDEFLSHRILFNCSKVTYIPISLYYYVQRHDSIIGSKFSLNKLDAIYAMIDRIEFFNEINEIKLRQKAEYSFILLFFDFYNKVKIECPNSSNELRKLRNVLRKKMTKLLYNPFFNKREKIFLVLFLINHNVHIINTRTK